MKKTLLIASAGLALAMGVGAAVGMAVNRPVEAKAATGDAWYLRGSMNDWTGNDKYKILDGGAPLIIDLAAGDEFKVVDDASSWSGTALNTFGGDATDHWYEYETNKWQQDIAQGSNGGNIYVNLAGKYAVSIVDGALFIDYGMFYYCGDDNSWGITPDSDHPALTVNGGSSTWALTKDEGFKIRYRDNDNGYTYGCFKYGNLADGDFYGSFYTNNDSNIICNIAGNYDVSVAMTNRTWTVRAVPHGVDPDDTGFVYVLDKYGNLLNENHYASTSDEVGRTMGMPGAIMETYSGTTHMYQQEFWVGMEKVVFNNNSSQSWSWDISGDYSNAGKCLILDGSTDSDGKWSSEDWVQPETAKFIENYMHFQDFDEEDGTQGTACKGTDGYYQLAKGAYEAESFAAYREELCTLDYVVERLQEWATANEETFTITNSVGAFATTNGLANVIGEAVNNEAFVIIALSAISIAAIGGYFYIRRRREQR